MMGGNEMKEKIKIVLADDNVDFVKQRIQVMLIFVGIAEVIFLKKVPGRMCHLLIREVLG